ncbi:PLDc_N domain-containing protein [Streptomyces sp. WAC05374]|uniref:PLD nuclease N-terminal domain-containing protein n=1 Tax=Streptomyces sp. WAC05374 TaxID=2487420 RepID=UPI000F87B712|nr:PLD nuclease N-terminal domain-containing protein [Streptomyces sp. WAC05374]RST18240.1 PLDc_N domain-containing protein [Streptomyces sp. WAC05374]TDF40431.1 PLDc_N domain-containing protein [Streptomyces sp. WAC05374]TDF49065.1 PLDc_N domain-containing protein [Streptomyces sp. WAC05374]TDF49551.1 PLDc_N domain-containing protein [Streptomyces sp. WAC05374]
MLRALLYILPLALTIYAFIDCLNTPEDEAKHLPKVAWIFIILLFWIVGPIVWLAAGKLRHAPAGGRTPSEWHRNHRWVAPDDNPEFLKSLRDEAVAAEDRKDTEDRTSAEDRKDESLPEDREADPRRREEELEQRERDERKDGESGPEKS